MNIIEQKFVFNQQNPLIIVFFGLATASIMGFLYKRLRNWMNGNSFRHLFVPRDLFIERPATYQNVINSIAFEACGACKRLQLTELFPCDTDVKYIMYIHYNSTCSFPTLFAIIDLNSLSHSCQAFATLSLNWFSIRLHCFWHSLEASNYII